MIDAASLVGSAVGIRTLRSPEPAPARAAPEQRRLADITGGWGWIFGHVGAPSGMAGLVVIVVADFLLLLSVGIFNPTFSTYRMRETADTHMARVGTAWSISSRTVQPIFMLLGGLLAATTSTRAAIGVAALLLLATGAFLPWRAGKSVVMPGRA